MTELLKDVANYYTAKLLAYGESPQGVDWNGEMSQTLRFQQLCQIIPDTQPFTLNDLGCGYGALYDYLSNRYENFHYCGCDISEEMIVAAQKLHFNQVDAQFMVAPSPPEMADFTIASGIFNVRLERGNSEWRDYIQDTLEKMNKASSRGFAFNCLTSYSDENKKLDYLYYADPCEWFDLCKRQFSRQVALLHDYGLYEFTLLVRK